VLRYLGLLAMFFLLGYLFASLPPPEPAKGGGEAQLYDVEFHLFPSADPEAEWTLFAPEVDYDPKTKSARVIGGVRGSRRVKNEVDLKLQADEVVIDAADNLRMPEAKITLPKECWQMTLAGGVQIDQRQGYRARTFRLEGPGVRVEGKGFSADFGLKNARWQSGREEWQSGGDDAKKCD